MPHSPHQTVTDRPVSALTDGLRMMLGMAMLDEELQELLLHEPGMAASRFGLDPRERRAAAGVQDASSLVEYAARLEARLAHRPHNGHRQVA